MKIFKSRKTPEQIVSVIPFGHDSAITREELQALTGESDRINRDAINKSGELVINMQDGQGYFKPLPTENDLVEIFIKLHKARIKEENRRIMLARQWQQKNIFFKPEVDEAELYEQMTLDDMKADIDETWKELKQEMERREA